MLATVKTTSGGFTKGDMFFGNGPRIGWLSAEGTVSNLNWCMMTNSTTTNTIDIRGGLYVDQSGSFGGDLIVVTGGSSLDEGGGVWRVNSNGIPKLLVNITNQAHPHLEGVVTLTNDVQRWGPWAGKIITGGESKIPPLIHAIDTNGTVMSFDLGIAPEDFDVIPPNQDLYCVDQQAAKIVKVPHEVLTNYWGDLLITQEGEFVGSPALFIVHWNGSTANFESHTIPYINAFEHVTFAPTNLFGP